MFRTPMLAALALVAAAPSMPRPVAGEVPARSYPAIETIHWTYGPQSVRNGWATQLRFTHEGMNSSIDADDAPEIMSELATASSASPGEAVSFRLAHEAGSLACTGRVEGAGKASGACRFDPDQRFAAGLAVRGAPADDSDTLLALTLVDARLALVDGLTTAGYHLDDADDLIAVAALKVTPAYAGELRDAGLKIDEIDDLVAARALDVDAAWLGEMAKAGYPGLTAEQAIQMRALGVTPDYVKRMARVLRAVGEIG